MTEFYRLDEHGKLGEIIRTLEGSLDPEVQKHLDSIRMLLVKSAAGEVPRNRLYFSLPEIVRKDLVSYANSGRECDIESLTVYGLPSTSIFATGAEGSAGDKPNGREYLGTAAYILLGVDIDDLEEKSKQVYGPTALKKGQLTPNAIKAQLEMNEALDEALRRLKLIAGCVSQIVNFKHRNNINSKYYDPNFDPKNPYGSDVQRPFQLEPLQPRPVPTTSAPAPLLVSPVVARDTSEPSAIHEPASRATPPVDQLAVEPVETISRAVPAHLVQLKKNVRKQPSIAEAEREEAARNLEQAKAGARRLRDIDLREVPENHIPVLLEDVEAALVDLNIAIQRAQDLDIPFGEAELVLLQKRLQRELDELKELRPNPKIDSLQKMVQGMQGSLQQMHDSSEQTRTEFASRKQHLRKEHAAERERMNAQREAEIEQMREEQRQTVATLMLQNRDANVRIDGLARQLVEQRTPAPRPLAPSGTDLVPKPYTMTAFSAVSFRTASAPKLKGLLTGRTGSKKTMSGKLFNWLGQRAMPVTYGEIVSDVRSNPAAPAQTPPGVAAQRDTNPNAEDKQNPASPVVKKEDQKAKAA